MVSESLSSTEGSGGSSATAPLSTYTEKFNELFPHYLSFGMTEEADAIENAVNKVLDKGLRTADNMSEGCTCLGCTAMGDAILAEI